MEISEIVRCLEGIKGGLAISSQVELAERIEFLKQDAVNRGSEKEAKDLWILENVLLAQMQYLKAFHLLELKKFYDAWCMLERCEITLGALERHETDRWKSFHLDFIAEHVAKWQSIFPYKTFFSPEYIEHRKVCSICGDPVLPRSGCDHRLGDIYGGKMCYHVVTHADPISISMVENPVQKYSVAFPNDPVTGAKGDYYNYSVVQYARSVVLDPFDRWSAEHTTKLWPHSHFRHVGRNDPCPCGSKKKYKKCCLPKEGVLMPHTLIHVSTAIPEGIPNEFLSQPRA